MPCPKFIPALISEWEEMISEYYTISKKSDDCAELAEFLHQWFLCIHPFVDGNGRTARLMENSLRLYKGLGWKTPLFCERESYYSRIRRTESIFYERYYPTMYEQ